MIRRSALIIECSGISGAEKLPGAERDADSWREFLFSNKGGAWREGEVTVLSNPSKQAVLTKIGQMDSGYGFVTFSGHGYVISQTQATMVCLSGGDISELELTPKSKWATTILDSCRGEVTVAFSEAFRSVRKSDVPDSRYRNLFDNALEKAEGGVCRLYGCAFGQAAQESTAGGEFTQALIQSGRNWIGQGAYTLRNAFDDAVAVVQRSSPQQTPEAKLGRRLGHFPFAVRP